MSAPFFTADEIQELWDVQKSAHIDSCAVKARAEVPNTARGTVLGNPAVTQTVACVQLSETQAAQQGLFPDESIGKPASAIQFFRDITINASDEIEVNGDGNTWVVYGDAKKPGTLDPAFIAWCSLRKKAS